MNPLQSLPEYERFIYSLQSQHPSIRRSTLVVIRRGRAAARVTGELEIGEYRIVIREKLLFLTILSPPARILLAGSLVVGVSASVIMDEVNEAVVFPALGLSPP